MEEDIKRSINRFLYRIHIPDIKINIKKILINTYKIPLYEKNLKDYIEKHPNGKLLELYHSSKNIENQTINSIFKNGMMLSYSRKNGSTMKFEKNNNKGIFLSSHSRYSLSWGDKNVFICDVIPVENKIRRYVSEVCSPLNNNEYIVLTENIIYPKYYIEYDTTYDYYNFIIKENMILCHLECKKCKYIICHCELIPNIDIKDFY